MGMKQKLTIWLLRRAQASPDLKVKHQTLIGRKIVSYATSNVALIEGTHGQWSPLLLMPGPGTCTPRS